MGADPEKMEDHHPEKPLDREVTRLPEENSHGIEVIPIREREWIEVSNWVTDNFGRNEANIGWSKTVLEMLNQHIDWRRTFLEK